MGEVPARQLRLFTYSKPLSERFGAAFFRGLPKTPGVYLMFDANERLIYVGQSVNLRQRLGSYRHIHPDRSSRKLVRLVHSVSRITWEECTTHEAAKLRENVLLREQRPRFNSLNTWPKAHCFVRLHWGETSIEFSFTREMPADGVGYFGAFKTGVMHGYLALLRLLWTVFFQTIDVYQYPRLLLGERIPKQFAFPNAGLDVIEAEQWRRVLVQFFDGESDALCEKIANGLPGLDLLSSFHRNLLTDDFEQMQFFYERGSWRNAELRRKHALSEPLIKQEQLDDLLVVQKPVQ